MRKARLAWQNALAVSLLFLFLFCQECCSAAQFLPLGDLPGGEVRSFATGVSGDGSVVIGASFGANAAGVTEAYRWTRETGMIALGIEIGQIQGRPVLQAVSNDGRTIIGYGRRDSTPLFAITYDQNQGFKALDGSQDTNHFSSVAHAVNRDGTMLVGNLILADDPMLRSRAFTWTEKSGYALIGGLPGGNGGSSAYGVSADGRYIVGTGLSANGGEAFLWSQTDGMQLLGDIPGGAFDSGASAVSDDGSVVVGFGRSAESLGDIEAMCWTAATGAVGLGDLPGGNFSSSANDVSANGRIIVGRSDAGTMDGAVIWRDGGPIENLREVLISDYGLGGALAGWSLGTANAISADGLTIVGEGINPDGNLEAWLVRLDVTPVPEPTTLSLVAATLITLAAIAARRAGQTMPRIFG